MLSSSLCALLFCPCLIRFIILSIRIVSSHSRCNASSGFPQSSIKSYALSRDRGKPSSKTRRPGNSRILRRTRVVIVALDTRSPRAMISAHSLPRGVSRATSSRKRLPLLKCATPHSSTRRSQSNPFPDPGPPTTSTMRAGFWPRTLSAPIKNSSRCSFSSPLTSTTRNNSLSVSSSGRSPMLVSSLLTPSRQRYVPALSTPPTLPPWSVFANWLKRSVNGSYSQSAKARDPGFEGSTRSHVCSGCHV
mmetsp:Transcript_28203/g.37530  ORF Transcript_28203/g.37530 Transcript_28203/m.37530 type:complete len:248 (+) Transcript_28203:867-1610(+)